MRLLADQFIGDPTPFVGLRGRLTQCWASTTTLVLIVYMVRLQILKHTLQSGVTIAYHESVSACKTADASVSAVFSIAHSMVEMINHAVSSAVEEAIKSTLEALNIMVTVIEELLLLMVHFWLGTWGCLTVSLVDFAADEVLDTAEKVVQSTNKTIEKAVDTLEDGLDGLSKVINGAETVMGTIADFFTSSKKDLKKVNLTIKGLRNIHIPANVTKPIEELRTKIPTWQDTKDKMDSFISTPFEALKREIGNTSVSFRPNSFTLPKRHDVSICNYAKVRDVFEHIHKAAATAADVITGLLAIVLFASILCKGFTTYRKWRRLETLSTELVQQQDRVFHKDAETSKVAATIYQTLRATGNGFENTILEFVDHRTQGSQVALWAVQYTTSRAALIPLALGLAGAVLTLLEYIVIRVVQNGLHNIEHFGEMGIKDATALIRQDIVKWRNNTNGEITSLQRNVNKNVLGWIQKGTGGINSTIAQFMQSIDDEVAKGLNNTPLYKPMNSVIYCIVGNKVQSFEKALTWVHDRANVKLPLVPPLNTTSLRAPLKHAGSTFNNALDALVKTLMHELMIQAVVSFMFIAIWILFVLGAAFYACKHYRRRNEVDLSPQSSFSSNDTLPVHKTLDADDDEQVQKPPARANGLKVRTTQTFSIFQGVPIFHEPHSPARSLAARYVSSRASRI